MKETKFKQTLVQTKKDSRHCEERSDAAIHGGFKMTEVGLIPNDWKVKPFKNVATLINGRAFSQSELLERGKYRVLRVGNFGTNDSWYYSNLELPEKMYCNKGDLLYCWSCTYGAYIWNEEKTIYHYHIWKIADLKAEKGYLQYILNNDVAQQMNSSNGSTMSHITKGFLENRLFAFPPTIEEQQRIANALSDIDTLIANLEKLIAKKKNIKQGAMQQLLTGRKRLPGFAPAKLTYKQTELGKIPTDWEVKKIGEFTKLQAGGTPSTLCDEFWGGNIRWMNSGELNNKRIYDVAGRITELGLNSSSTHLIPSNCVLVGLAGQGKTRGTAAINYVELCTNQSIAAMFPSKTHNSEYLYHNIDSRYEELRELSSGDGGRGGLNLGILANLFIALPSKEEQTAIANVLSDMDTEISALETKLAKYRTLKTGMMQQLLTGKIRLL